MQDDSGAQSRNSLVTEYQDYVRHIVGSMVENMGLPGELFDEFVAAGFLGLVEAAERYDRNSGVDFKHYAFLRIRGAVIDSIRECSDLSGKAYQYAKALRAVHDLREIDFSICRFSAEELEDELLAEFLEFAAKGALAFRLNTYEAEREIARTLDPGEDPEEQLLHRDDARIFHELLAELPENEKLIVTEYYFRDKTFSQIAEEHQSLSKSWISRLHSRALETLKERYDEKMSCRES